MTRGRLPDAHRCAPGDPQVTQHPPDRRLDPRRESGIGPRDNDRVVAIHFDLGAGGHESEPDPAVHPAEFAVQVDQTEVEARRRLDDDTASSWTGHHARFSGDGKALGPEEPRGELLLDPDQGPPIVDDDVPPAEHRGVTREAKGPCCALPRRDLVDGHDLPPRLELVPPEDDADRDVGGEEVVTGACRQPVQWGLGDRVDEDPARFGPHQVDDPVVDRGTVLHREPRRLLGVCEDHLLDGRPDLDRLPEDRLEQGRDRPIGQEEDLLE
ncbi:hypothetical protein DSECCO2_377210 [anaerobic digester metagenome]